MTFETKSLTDAQDRHPGCYFEIVDHADTEGLARSAIYVWRTREDAEADDGARAVAIYWRDTSADEAAYQLRQGPEGVVVREWAALTDEAALKLAVGRAGHFWGDATFELVREGRVVWRIERRLAGSKCHTLCTAVPEPPRPEGAEPRTLEQAARDLPVEVVVRLHLAARDVDHVALADITEAAFMGPADDPAAAVEARLALVTNYPEVLAKVEAMLQAHRAIRRGLTGSQIDIARTALRCAQDELTRAIVARR